MEAAEVTSHPAPLPPPLGTLAAHAPAGRRAAERAAEEGPRRAPARTEPAQGASAPRGSRGPAVALLCAAALGTSGLRTPAVAGAAGGDLPTAPLPGAAPPSMPAALARASGPGVTGSQRPTGERARVELPEGPAAKAVAGIGPDTVPLPAETLPDPQLFASPDPSAKAEAWARWAELVAAEAAAPEPEPARRAALALLAHAQGRDEDAWEHLARTAADPRATAAVLPFLWPGVPAGTAVEAGARPAPLPAGVLLAPSLPPGGGEAASGHAAPVRVRWEGLRVGEARVDLELAVEPTGVELTAAHAAGPPVTVRALLPAPAGREIRVTYVDWMRQDDPSLPLQVRLSSADEEAHVLFGRYAPRPVRYPRPLDRLRPKSLELGGLWLVPAAQGPSDGELDAAASAFERVLDVSCRVRRAPPADAEPFPGLAVHLGAGAERARTLAWLAGLAEAWVLTR